MANMRRENAFPLRLLKKDPQIEALRKKYLKEVEEEERRKAGGKGSPDKGGGKTQRTFSNLR